MGEHIIISGFTSQTASRSDADEAFWSGGAAGGVCWNKPLLKVAADKEEGRLSTKDQHPVVALWEYDYTSLYVSVSSRGYWSVAAVYIPWR